MPHYHLRFGNRPLCDHMASLAGLRMCEEAGVTQCGFHRVKDAREAMRKLNAVPGWAGIASVSQGECPRAKAL
jgi:hypothetical protein